MNKIKIGGILYTKNLTLIRILGFQNKPGYAGKLLGRFGKEKINLQFIAECVDVYGDANLTICVDQKNAKRANRLIAESSKQLDKAHCSSIDNIISLSVYGPHFREKPSICASMFKALGKAKINILGISTSISSICCIISQEDLAKAKKSLFKVFELP